MDQEAGHNVVCEYHECEVEIDLRRTKACFNSIMCNSFVNFAIYSPSVVYLQQLPYSNGISLMLMLAAYNLQHTDFPNCHQQQE